MDQSQGHGKKKTSRDWKAQRCGFGEEWRG